MDVLKRRMFQAGGSVEASNVLGRGSGFISARPGMRRFERDENGNVLFTTYDTAGNIIQEELVDMRLSATGDPEEALARQRQNKAASAGVDAALTLVGGRAAKFGVDEVMKTPFGKATRDVLAKAAEAPINLGKKGIEALLPVKLTQKFVANPKVGKPKTDIFGKPVMKDGKPVLETAKKLEDRSLFNLQNIKDGGFEVKPFTSTLYGVPTFLGARSGLQDLVTQESEMAEIMDREVEDGLQEQIDNLQPTPAPTPEPTPEPTLEPEEEIEQEQQEAQGQQRAQVAANSLSNFFSSSAFNDALRNIGGSLVREGRFGAGLASGAASFADEQEAKSLLEQEQKSEFEKFLLEKSLAGDGMDFGDLAKVGDVGEGVNEAIRNFEGSNASIGIMNDLIALFEEAQEKGVPVTGLQGRLERFKDEASAFLGIEKEASTATKIQNMINIVKNRQIRELLGESGRTISNLDREIVDKVFGQISFTDNPKESLKKLKEARGTLQSSARQYQRDVRTGREQLRSKQAGNVGQTYMSEYGNLIEDILNIDVDKIITAGYNPTVGTRVVKIKLRGE